MGQMEREQEGDSRFLNTPFTRRRAIKAGGIAAVGLAFSKPLIDTIVPKSAFANYIVNGTEGCTPGYWKNHEDSWPSSYSTSDKFADIFNVPGNFTDSLGNGKTLLQVLEQGGGCEKALGRHGVAALLNAVVLGNSYGLTEVQVITEVNDALATGNCDTIEAKKDDLDTLNNQGCPLGAKVADP